MAIGDTYRKIEPTDQLVFDSAGRLAGVRSGQSGAAEGRLISEAAAAANQALVSGAGIADAASLTLTTAMANTTRIPAGTQTYTVDAATAWSVGDGAAIFLPASGTVSFAVSGGPTLNGATTTLTRTLAGNAIGYVVLSRIAGTNVYSLSGA